MADFYSAPKVIKHNISFVSLISCLSSLVKMWFHLFGESAEGSRVLFPFSLSFHYHLRQWHIDLYWRFVKSRHTNIALSCVCRLCEATERRVQLGNQSPAPSSMQTQAHLPGFVLFLSFHHPTPVVVPRSLCQLKPGIS